MNKKSKSLLYDPEMTVVSFIKYSCRYDFPETS